MWGYLPHAKSRMLAVAVALLAAFYAVVAVGCYCENFRRCHRSILKEILVEHGAKVAEG